MPRYYFHIKTPHQVDRDAEGDDLASLAEARAYACEAVRAYVAETERPNLELIGGSSFEITDKRGRRKLILPFVDALPSTSKAA